jgi:hypothetical protein
MGAETIYIDGSHDGSEKPSLSQDCGACGAPLIVGVSRGAITDLVLRCPACGAFNDTKWGSDSSRVPRFPSPIN